MSLISTPPFLFFDPGILVDRELSLIGTKTTPADAARNLVPCYFFAMRVRYQDVGAINLRIGHTPHIQQYAGHIGYGVDAAHRGHHYAERACRLLLPLAIRHGINPLWITCNPDNTPSKRTCERLGAHMVEIVSLPQETDMYNRGERMKCRYRIDL